MFKIRVLVPSIKETIQIFVENNKEQLPEMKDTLRSISGLGLKERLWIKLSMNLGMKYLSLLDGQIGMEMTVHGDKLSVTYKIENIDFSMTVEEEYMEQSFLQSFNQQFEKHTNGVSILEMDIDSIKALLSKLWACEIQQLIIN